MKKTYTKPDIYFDNFAMCTDIAGTCTYVTNTPSQMKCGLPYTDSITVFTNGLIGNPCNFVVGTNIDDAQFNGVCLHVPAGNRSLFNS